MVALAIVNLQIAVWINILRLVYTILDIHLQKLKKVRSCWTKPQLNENIRNRYGAFRTLFQYFRENSPEEFYDFVGMTVEQFDRLMLLVGHRLIKRSRRKALEPELRVAAVLNYLRHGTAIKPHCWFFYIGCSTMYKLVPEVCGVIHDELKRTYLIFPSQLDWLNIASDFENLWNFSHVLGALDGKHIRIGCPPHSGSLFHNYKSFYSVVLMALVDANKRFIWVNVGEAGSSNDAGIFQRSDLGRLLEAGLVQLPIPSNLPRTDIEIPFFIVGDAAFGLHDYLLTPFSRMNNLTVRQKVFNYRLSRARLVSECAFGILTKKWKVFECAMKWKLGTVDKIVMSLVCLHNFLITDEMQNDVERYGDPDEYDDSESEDEEDDDDDDIGLYEDGDPQTAIALRNALADYFVSDYGAVPWQWDKIV